MIKYQENLNKWLNGGFLKEEEKEELELLIKNNETKEIEERFYKSLSFGTAGLRGIIGIGTNRINIYMIRLVTQGLANYINKNYTNSDNVEKAIAIAYDTRIMSKEFALETALVMAANGIKAYLFADVTSTPQLSYTIRDFGVIAGVVITASHNPSKYNGYKVYWQDGGQIVPPQDSGIINEVNMVGDINKIIPLNCNEAIKNNLLVMIDKSYTTQYVKEIIKSIPNNVDTDKNFKITYTPIHGSGLLGVTTLFQEMGFKNVYIPQNQCTFDGRFPTVKSPNPEEIENFKIAIEVANANASTLILATDPDCDRVGTGIKKDGKWQYLNGNEIGILLLDYILKTKGKTIKNPVVISSIVSTPMAKIIADSYGVLHYLTPTGFKYIGELMHAWESEAKTNTNHKNFLFAFEESFGYLCGTYSHDKDATIACGLLAQYAANLALENKDLLDALDELLNKHGCYTDKTYSIDLEDKEGAEQIERFMTYISKNKNKNRIKDHEILTVENFNTLTRINLNTLETEKLDFTKNNMIIMYLASGARVIVRPSGTEPKIKIYINYKGNNKEQSNKYIENLWQAFQILFNDSID